MIIKYAFSRGEDFEEEVTVYLKSGDSAGHPFDLSEALGQFLADWFKVDGNVSIDYYSDPTEMFSKMVH